MRRRLAVLVLSCVVVPLWVLAAPAVAQEGRTPLAVEGRGLAEARPDRVEVSYVLRRDAGSREAARASVARRARSLVGRLRSLGIEASAIRLSRVNVGRRGRAGLRRPFRAIGVVAARTPAVSLAGRMIDLAPALGADVRGPSYDLVDDVAAREAATTQAVASARRRAEAVARGLDMRIVGVRSVSLDGAQITQAPVGEGQASVGVQGSADVSTSGGAPRGPSTPTAPGTIRIRATVTVNFELAPA